MKLNLMGLTGGIASGKSTVADMFLRLGAVVVDADQIARLVVQPHTTGWKQVVKAFGRDILQTDQHLDRNALGRIIFTQPEKRKLLNSILHPLIGQESQKQFQQYEQQGVAWLIYEAPLIVENNLKSMLRELVVVYVDEQVQLNRLRVRDGLIETSALQRLQSQMSLAEKLAGADHVIDNNGDFFSTQVQVEKIYQHWESTWGIPQALCE